jgi:hypothetical protein
MFLNYLAFQPFNFERTWWRLFQKHVVCPKFDIYSFLCVFGQLKDSVGQVLFLVSCPKVQVEKYVNVEAWFLYKIC